MATWSSTTGTISFPWTATVWTTTRTASSIEERDYVWHTWNTTASTTYTRTNEVWATWQEWHEPVMLSAEEQQRLDDEAQRLREERSRRRLEEMQRIEGARERARELFDLVVAEQDKVPGLDLLQFEGSDGHLYRIEMHRRTVHGNVVRVDEHGCSLGRACVAPRMADGNLAMPTEDGWIGQYLGLKFDAEEFLSHANWSGQRGCQQVPAQIAA
jgi:hypothetical protein